MTLLSNCQSPTVAICTALSLAACDRSALVPPGGVGERPDAAIAPAEPGLAAPATAPALELATAAMPPLAEEPAAPRELALRLGAAAESEQRAAIVTALWALGSPEAVDILRQHLSIERDADVKVDIVAGLAGWSSPGTREARFGILVAALAPPQAREVRLAAATLAAEFDDARAVSLLQSLLQDADEELRQAARDAIDERQVREPR